MKNIVAFAGSNSKDSINKKLAIYAANQVDGGVVNVLDLNDFELPMYGIDYEQANGIPARAQDFLNLIKDADGLVLSLAEHNGAYAAVFKNLLDWMSRIDGKLWSDKPMLLMATSPGGRGGQTVLEIAANKFPRMGANVVETFSLPNFGQNLTADGIEDAVLKHKFQEVVSAFAAAL